MVERLCLKWNDFEENVKNSFGSLRDDDNFIDVTLACEDGQQFEAHKVVLASSSPFFHKILRGINHARPLLYLKGMKSVDVGSILDFLYLGEANVDQENLESFLAVAEELQLKGLMGQKKYGSAGGESGSDKLFGKGRPTKTFTDDRKDPENFAKGVLDDVKETLPLLARDGTGSRNVAVANLPLDEGQLDDLDEKVKSMMERSPNMIANGKSGQIRASICKVCGKEGLGRNIKRHIEANHLEGQYVHHCNLCGKICRSRNMLWEHKHKNHSERIN